MILVSIKTYFWKPVSGSGLGGCNAAAKAVPATAAPAPPAYIFHDPANMPCGEPRAMSLSLSQNLANSKTKKLYQHQLYSTNR